MTSSPIEQLAATFTALHPRATLPWRLQQIRPRLPDGDGAKCPHCGVRQDENDVAYWASAEQSLCANCGQWFYDDGEPELKQRELFA